MEVTSVSTPTRRKMIISTLEEHILAGDRIICLMWKGVDYTKITKPTRPIHAILNV